MSTYCEFCGVPVPPEIERPKAKDNWWVCPKCRRDAVYTVPAPYVERDPEVLRAKLATAEAALAAEKSEHDVTLKELGLAHDNDQAFSIAMGELFGGDVAKHVNAQVLAVPVQFIAHIQDLAASLAIEAAKVRQMRAALELAPSAGADGLRQYCRKTNRYMGHEVDDAIPRGVVSAIEAALALPVSEAERQAEEVKE